MSNNDWFRRKTWTTEVQGDFFDRLRRSRGASKKAQYARIQAYELQTVGTTAALIGAVDLLNLILAEWRSEAQLAAVHHQFALCFLGLGQQERAIESFREVFEAQRRQPSLLTDAHLDFGWLSIAVPLPALFSEVIGVLDEFRHQPILPIQIYRDSAIRCEGRSNSAAGGGLKVRHPWVG